MISKCWIEKQVLCLPLAELKAILKRKRLRVSRAQLVEYLWVLWEQHTNMCHFKTLHKKEMGVGYAGLMAGVELAAPLFFAIEKKFKQMYGIRFDDLTIADSSLLPAKEEKSIKGKDWKRGRVTTRPRSEGSGVMHICGEKHLCLINSKNQIVFSALLPSINSPDDHVFKHPMAWAQRGMKNGVLLIDRGFANKAVQQGFDFLNKNLPSFSVQPIYPPRKFQKWSLTPENKILYKKRWRIEEVFRQLKDPLGSFRLVLKGVRKPLIIQAKVAISTLAWNAQHV